MREGRQELSRSINQYQKVYFEHPLPFDDFEDEYKGESVWRNIQRLVLESKTGVKNLSDCISKLDLSAQYHEHLETCFAKGKKPLMLLTQEE